MTAARRCLFPVITALLVLGCGQDPVSPTVIYDKETLAAKYQAISSIVSLRVCATSLQCSSIGIGSKPCGGPWRYIVYSKVNVNEQELKRRVDDLFAFEREYNRRNGIISDCSIARPANPACVDGQCIDLNSSNR